jgi:hypothetical protein
MANRVDISGGKTAEKKSEKAAKGEGMGSANAIKLGIAAVCVILAGVFVYFNFFHKPAPPPPTPAFNPEEHMDEKQKVEYKKQLEDMERDLKKRPPAGA